MTADKFSELNEFGAAPADGDQYLGLDVSDLTAGPGGTVKRMNATRVARTGAANTFTAAQSITPASGVGLTVNGASGQVVAALKTSAGAAGLSVESTGAVRAGSGLIQGAATLAMASDQVRPITDWSTITVNRGLMIIQAGNRTGVFVINPAAVALVADEPSGAYFSATKDTASKVNVYAESNVIQIQNKTGGSTTTGLVVINGY